MGQWQIIFGCDIAGTVRSSVTIAGGHGGTDEWYCRWRYNLWPGSAHAGARQQGDQDKDSEQRRCRERCFIHGHIHEIA